MKTTVEMVAEFHRAFGLGHDRPPAMPKLNVVEAAYVDAVARQLTALGASLKAFAEDCGKSETLLRLQLLVEETGELADAYLAEDLEAAADALTDIQYVLDGTYVTVGMDHLKQLLFEEVHRSNMAKLDENGKPIIGPSGRVVKPEGWTAPDLGSIIRGTGS